MKSIVKTMFVVLAIVMSFAFVQYGWAKITAIYGPNEVTGTVIEGRVKLVGDPIVIDPDAPSSFNYPIYDWGPDSYWDSLDGISLPQVGDHVTVYYYTVVHNDGGTERVAAELTEINGAFVSVPLHDKVYSETHDTWHLVPLWDGSPY